MTQPSVFRARKHLIASIALGGLLLGLTACTYFPPSSGTTAEEPLLTGANEWEERSLEVDGKSYLCIIKAEGYNSEELECDWEHPNPPYIPADIQPLAPPGDKEWELQYMETSTGQQLTCVVKLKRHSRSCQWGDR